MFSLSQAAKWADVSKATIDRALKSGKLSGTRQDDGSYQIDPADLARVYRITVPPETSSAAVPEGIHETPRNPPNPLQNGHDDPFAAVLAAELAGTRELIRRLEAQAEVLRRDRDAQIEDMRRDREDFRRDRDAWRQQAEPSQLILTHARETPPSRRPWWKRLAG